MTREEAIHYKAKGGTVRAYPMKKHYIHAGWINCCMLCEYNHQKRYEKPCQGCKRRTNPKVPAKELIIAGTKYLRGGDKE